MAKASQAVILENEFYIIKAPNGKVLEVKNFNTENGAAIQLWSYAGHPWQQWQFVDAGGGRWRIQNRFTGKVIDLAFPAIDPATNEAVLDSLAAIYADHILHLSPDAVLCQGECTFVYRVVQRLEAAGIPTLAACSRRKSLETTYPDGSTLKRSIFAFAGFRRYGSP